MKKQKLAVIPGIYQSKCSAKT